MGLDGKEILGEGAVGGRKRLQTVSVEGKRGQRIGWEVS